MCADIIFHIGYPKTATTLLQRGMFRQIPALGCDSSVPSAERLEFEIRKMVNQESMEMWSSPRGQSIVESILALGGNTNPILYSSEHWLRGPMQSYPEGARPVLPELYTHLASDHICGLSKYGWGNRGRVRVMVTLRNQTSWLGSKYAQNSDRRSNAGQEDFENFIRCVIDDESSAGRHFLDYDRLYEDLCSIVGRENVLFLMCEEIGQPSFKTSFMHWTGYTGFDHEPDTGVKHNVRRVESNKWKTRPNSRIVRSRPFEILDYTAKRVFGLDIRKPVKKVVAAISHTEIIELTPRMSSYIQEHYRDSNERLDRKLNLGLKNYGYY